MRSGYVYTDYATLRFAGIYGYDWSRVSRSSVERSNYLDFRDLETYPSNDYTGRYTAFHVQTLSNFVSKKGLIKLQNLSKNL